MEICKAPIPGLQTLPSILLPVGLLKRPVILDDTLELEDNAGWFCV